MVLMVRPLLLALLAPAGTILALDDPKKESRKAAVLPPCGACSNLVSSFERGLERTARGKFEGGDTAWEEKNQGTGYAASEVRLVEIEEDLCKDVERGEQQCHSNHHDWEEHLEEWWKLDHDDDNPRPALRQWLCVERLRFCCPENHYGPDCVECSLRDSNGRICSGAGRCKGAGTRKGNGKCACESGYAGEICDECAVGHYQSYRDEDKTLCSPCHRSCQLHCSGPGAKGCVSCAAGFRMDAEHGCVDIDECLVSKPCAGNKFCVNTEGAYKCVKCDAACNGCEGDGPDTCLKCADGYTLNKDGTVCITEEAAGRIFTISNTRFFTYAGLCIAACIIFQRSVAVAGCLGLVIAVYISVSEYYLMGSTGDLKPV